MLPYVFSLRLRQGLESFHSQNASSAGSDAHGAFAAEMVVGLAGSSYKSAW